MTQLGEAVAIADVKSFENQCPFPHEECQHTPAKNDFEGDAEKLGKNLDKTGFDGSTVQRSEAPFAAQRIAKAHDPEPMRPPPGKPKDWENWVQLTPGNDRTWYPVGFQAHHLIPAAASLKNSSLRKYIDKGGKGSRLCCNLGYDVNGKENGVWLPGKHAVAGGDLGLNLWGSARRKLPKDEDFQRPGVARGPRDDKNDKSSNRYLPLDGKTPSKQNQGALGEVFHEKNLKWRYVQAAMRVTRPMRQFHDSHTDYSRKVNDHLKAVAETLAGFHRVGPSAGACKKGCSEKTKVPPTPTLLKLLNRLAQVYKNEYLVGSDRHAAYYTSNWCKKKT